MEKAYTYLLVDLGCLLIPFLFSFHPKLKFVSQWKNFIVPCILTALFFLVWDIWFTHLGIWWFNPDYILGVYIYNLPLEEVLFFICIPYACVFTYYCLTLFINYSFKWKFIESFLYAVSLGLVIVALYYPFKLYTSITFSLVAIVITLLLHKNKYFLGNFLVSYLMILPFFFISNGILTGSFIDNPVVIYNNEYNLSIRIFTIPIEDIFYGMLLLLLNVTGFEYLKNKRAGRVEALNY